VKRAVARAEERYERKELLTDQERGAWIGLTQTYASCVRRLDDELRHAHAIPLRSLELLWQLQLASEGRMRMVELADHLVFTRSGMTRLIERLERDGLVERCGVEGDARGTYAAITEEGIEAFKRAADTAANGLRRIFFDKLDDDDLAGLNDIWSRFEWPSNREREARRRLAVRPVGEADQSC
jgi:DNA-binding MarR family transcriptional regulator